MKFNKLLLTGLVILCTAFFAFSSFNTPDSEEVKAVKAVIEKSYVNGAFNGLDSDAMRAGFHEDFAIFSAKGEEISKYPIAVWADGVAKRKAKPEFDAAKNVWTHKFVSVDVTGGAAAVKIELSHDGKHVYTDYLSLLKFDSGWRIAAKVYHSHEK
jgi:hypothetical protein